MKMTGNTIRITGGGSGIGRALAQRFQPTPKEILVERVGLLRWAERDGRFDQVVGMLSTN